MDDAVLIASPPPGVVLVDARHEGATAEHACHRHDLGQLQIIEQGLMAVETGSGWWILPPGRLGWLPPRWPHAGRSFGAIRVMILYVDADRASLLPTSPSVLALSPFVSATFHRLHDLGTGEEARRHRLLDVLCDEILAAREEPLHLPMPRRPQLARLCRTLIDHPDDPRDLDQWAREIGLSRRSLSRHMVAETGLSFGRWRTQAQLMAAIRLLAEQKSVTEVSLSLGFDSVSTFIASFRKHFGTTPMRYLRGA